MQIINCYIDSVDLRLFHAIFFIKFNYKNEKIGNGCL